MQSLRPKKYIKITQKSSKYQCTICNYIAEKPYLCRGPCQKLFCYQCIKCIQKNSDACPYRCSKPFELKECQEIQLQFTCPFNQKCQEQINNIAAFNNHSNTCKFIPENWKQRQQNYKRFRCESGHDLYYLAQKDLRKLYSYDFYEEAVNSMCSLCQQKSLCRSICPKCSVKGKFVLYCTNCRKPPCTKTTCLYSHQLKAGINFGGGLYCDFCGVNASQLGPKIFKDRQCNFDICQSCYINLPESSPLVPSKMAEEAINHLALQYQSEEDEDEDDFLELEGALEGDQDPFLQELMQQIEGQQDEQQINQFPIIQQGNNDEENE